MDDLDGQKNYPIGNELQEAYDAGYEHHVPFAHYYGV